MKFWIIRLDGNFVASANYQSMVKVQDEIQTNDGKENLLESDRVMDELKLNDSVKSIINHSRTQSLSLYENELIYCKMQENSYYYRAKHSLLFIYVEQFKQNLQLKVSSIDNVILRAIKLYEARCEKISCTYKLPRVISKYQEKQLERLDQAIKEIVYQQECLELEMPLLRRESSLREDSVSREMAKLSKQMTSIQEIGARRDQLREIEHREQRLKKQPLMFQRYSAKNLSGYRLKLYCLGVLLFFIVISSGLLYSYHNSRNEILI